MPEYITYTKRHHLKNFDYSFNTAYMITICAADRDIRFSRITRGDDGHAVVDLTPLGRHVEDALQGIETHFPHVTLDVYAIMPTHVHFLISVNKCEETDAKTKLVPRIVRGFKTAVRQACGRSVFQLNYYDVIADSDRLYDRCWDYIRDNPGVWLQNGAEPELAPALKKERPAPLNSSDRSVLCCPRRSRIR